MRDYTSNLWYKTKQRQRTKLPNFSNTNVGFSLVLCLTILLIGFPAQAQKPTKMQKIKALGKKLSKGAKKIVPYTVKGAVIYLQIESYRRGWYW